MTNLDQKVRELRALAEKATPGLWNNSGGSVDDFDADCMMRMEWMPNGIPSDGDDEEVNANYTAAAAYIAALSQEVGK